MNIEETRAFLEMLKSVGVSRWKGIAGMEVFEVDFAPASVAVPVAQDLIRDDVSDGMCACGHSIPVEHGDGGLCLRGCEVEKCRP